MQKFITYAQTQTSSKAKNERLHFANLAESRFSKIIEKEREIAD
jgi:hypothetical protein